MKLRESNIYTSLIGKNLRVLPCKSIGFNTNRMKSYSETYVEVPHRNRVLS